MADRSLRGIRLGAQSLQSEEGVVFHERAQHAYNVFTSCGRDTVDDFRGRRRGSPEAWECRTCGAEALLRVGDGTASVDHSGDKSPAKRIGTCCSSDAPIPELEELLEERLAYVRARRGAGEDVTLEQDQRLSLIHSRRAPVPVGGRRLSSSPADFVHAHQDPDEDGESGQAPPRRGTP